MKKVLFFLTFSFLLFTVISQEVKELTFVEEMEIIRRAYPNIQFVEEWNDTLQDYKINVSVTDLNGKVRKSVLYRAEGRYLTEKQLSNKENFTKLIYSFPLEVMDPSSFSEEMLARISNFSSKENRSKGAVTGTSFFDAIYGTVSQTAAASYMKKITMFGFSVTVHERIAESLKNVEKEINILSLMQTDEGKEAKEFIRSLKSVDCYLWRNIRDTQGRSFHSMGLAVDFLPKNLNSKAIYWNWERNGGNDKWMLIPLDKRWMPPKAVINIFEKAGFCWGGKWAIWDNMHFEYRPELLVSRDYF